MNKAIDSAVVGVAATAGLAAVAMTGCSAGHTTPAPTVTVTNTQTVTQQNAQPTAKPAPTVTKTVIVAEPAPTVTTTVSAASGQAGGGGSTPGGSPAPSSGANQIIIRFNGSGTQNTGSFTTPDTWHLSWSYWGCPGGTSNFQVTEYNADGSVDLNGISVNELGTGRGPAATYAYGDAGTHYLSVNTESCSWSLVPVTG
jgi:hypothetical protein